MRTALNSDEMALTAEFIRNLWESHCNRLNWPTLGRLNFINCNFRSEFLMKFSQAPLSEKCLHTVIGSNLYQTLFGHTSPSCFQVCSLFPIFSDVSVFMFVCVFVFVIGWCICIELTDIVELDLAGHLTQSSLAQTGWHHIDWWLATDSVMCPTIGIILTSD